MSAAPHVLDALTHPRDRVLFSQTPMLMMPSYGPLPTLEFGRRRYIAAADGIYLQARTRALDLTLRLASFELPFGPLQEQVALIGGFLPRALYQEIAAHALAQAPKEWAGLVHWSEADERYVLTVPEIVEVSNAHIRYRGERIDQQRLVLDIHSHGLLSAGFSARDDTSDECGIHFASVLGNCQSAKTMTAITRLVVDGQFFELNWHPWEES